MIAKISERWETFIREQMRSGRYGSQDEVLDEALRLLRQRDLGQTAGGQAGSDAPESVPVWQRVLEHTSAVPNEVFDRIPADSAEQQKPGEAAKRPETERGKMPLSPEEFDRRLLELGLMSRLPDTEADFDDPDDEPIDLEGEPLSETILRERR